MIGSAYLAAAGVVGTVVAVTLSPWARYGGIDIDVVDLPNWGFYLSSVVALHLCVGWALARRGRGGSVWPPRVVAVVLGAVAITSTVVVLSRYRDAEALFGPVVPLVAPTLGWGGPVAVAAILVSAGAVVTPGRRSGISTPPAA